MKNKKLKITKPIINSSSISVIHYLPTEVIQEILSRLPINTLFDSRYVCHSWRDLIITDTHFPIKHYKQVCRRIRPIISLIVYACDFNELYYIPDFNRCDNLVKFNKLTFKSWLPTFKVIGSCNGFICLADDSGRYRSIFICNPVIGDVFLVPDNVTFFGYAHGAYFGFGYDMKTNVYKVVKMRYITDEKYYQVEIHTLGTNTWRNIGKVKEILGHLSTSSGVLVNGSLHWLGTLHDSETASVIMVSLADEKLQDILPISIESIVGEINRGYHMGELGGRLIIVDTGCTEYVNVWVMEEYGIWASWTKQFSVKRPPVSGIAGYICFRPLVVQENGDILVEVFGGALYVYNPTKRRPYRKIYNKGLPALFKAVPHSGTLVPFKSAIETAGM
ncbi:hypothetical protein AQUCO_01200194v1 [Aquilegia coerulea]|uniref:F-box domain-containing protein n=1 Tax=Aquilegia coerulea TaxID=218851 RepID=A0A2G5E4U9_AQUCA|nr:hypothetical protein AQUCO_01200194v1 [Aquilegia coerulea]